jgi:hypothetical protein
MERLNAALAALGSVGNLGRKAGVKAKAFAITVELENGSSVPTMPILMIGAGK